MKIDKVNESIDQLFLKKKKLFVSIALDILKNPDQVDDILQEVYLSASEHWEKISKFEEHRQILYLCATTKNKALTIFNKKKRHQEKVVVLDECLAIPGETSIEALVISQEKLRETKACINNLEEDFRIVLILSVFYQLPDAEIAKELGITENLVRVRKNRGRNKIKAKLKEVGHYDGEE